jgi:hypothetical protein
MPGGRPAVGSAGIRPPVTGSVATGAAAQLQALGQVQGIPTQGQTQAQAAQAQALGQVQAAQAQVKAAQVATGSAGPIGPLPPVPAINSNLGNTATTVPVTQGAPVNYITTTNNYIMDDTADLSILTGSKQKNPLTGSSTVAPYESAISV